MSKETNTSPMEIQIQRIGARAKELKLQIPTTLAEAFTKATSKEQVKRLWKAYLQGTPIAAEGK